MKEHCITMAKKYVPLSKKEKANIGAQVNSKGF
jgi:hypothetical protein